MPVNTAALKTFAPAMRRQLLEAVGRKLDLLLNSQTPDTLSTYATQIAELREQEAENREQLLERVAYTWFNRLCALRYLDAKGWHPFGCKVLMPAAEGETQPELLKLMRAGSLPTELKAHTNEARLDGLLDAQIPPAIAGADPQGEVFRELVLASCRSHHQLLPELFEGLDDASELLLPDDLLSEGSIAGGFRSAISDEDCEDVEIIGWLYQFYISEKKDQVIGKVVKSEDIPAATQLFTPNWIVKYMVQNTLGATWLATYPDSPLKRQMEFYIEPAEQTLEVQAQLAEITPESLDPETLTLIDPACGSGHILVEAYELLKEIYLERGYQQLEIPRLIMKKNLFGLDIDERAAQLTSLALILKGRGDDKRLFERGIRLNVMAMVNSNGLDVETLAHVFNLSDYGLKLVDLVEIRDLFEHATTLGSLIQIPPRLVKMLPAFKRMTEVSNPGMISAEPLNRLKGLVRQAEFLSAEYDAVAVNPPYVGERNIRNAVLKNAISDLYRPFKADLFACFMNRSSYFCRPSSCVSMVTMHGWMFLSSFRTVRDWLLGRHALESLVHLGAGAFPEISGEIVQSVTFSYKATPVKGNATVCIDAREARGTEKASLIAGGAVRAYSFQQDDFSSFPDRQLAYWAGSSIRRVFRTIPALGIACPPLQGATTSDNNRFLRQWHEVDQGRVGFQCQSREEARASGSCWFPFNKGGAHCRWYGNRDYVLNYKNDGQELKGFHEELNKTAPGGRLKNQEKYFDQHVSWSRVSGSDFCCRDYDSGFIFSDSGSAIFPRADERHYYCGLLNSVVFRYLIRCLSPSIHFQAEHVSATPALPPLRELAEVAERCVEISSADWDSCERSWDFKSFPLIAASAGPRQTLESSYIAWIAGNKETIAEMKRLEEENNRLFIGAYGLQDELTPEVPIEQITLTVNPAYRYGSNITKTELWVRCRRDSMAEMLSYATGCMMGRYSLDRPGLILADSRDSQSEQLAAYEDKVGKPLSEVRFKPDPDGIIPVLDGEWFEDDIIARTREFLAVTFPESSVAENLRFIEDSLGKDIRKYFCSEFYKDHLQTYKKRPIYWMVQSPKKGFACLVYLHRYTKDTLNQVLNNYFRPYLQKLEARLAQLEQDQINDDLKPRERTAARKEAEKITKVLKECQAWEQESLLPLAQQRIALDLDDGVKVNYLKLQDVLAPIPGLAAKED